MLKLKDRLALLVAALLLVGLLAGCTSAPAPKTVAPSAPAAQATPASAPAPAPAANKDTVLKEGAVNFFNSLPPNSNIITADDYKKKLDAKDPTIYFVDIRRAEDFAKGHPAGAVNIPFAELGKQIDKLPKNKQIILMCYTGQTAGQAVGALRVAGYNAISFRNGFGGYEPSGLPIEK